MSFPFFNYKTGDNMNRSRVCLPSFVLAIFLSLSLSPAGAIAQDTPPPPQQLMTIPADSYVIPMDNTNQAVGTPFNLKAYGLANRLLQNGIPLLWAIKADKTKDAVDFSAAARRILPTAIASTTVNFAGGPFIVHPSYNQQAAPFINAFGNNVAVFRLTNATVVDVRYTLVHKPLIAVGTDNRRIHTDLFDFALIPNYVTVSETTVNADACTTLVTQPHTQDPAYIAIIKTFVQSGGNFLAECRAVNTYENEVPYGQFQTSAGYVIDNVDTVFTYPNGDMPFSQFIGALEPNPGGAEQDWYLPPTSGFINGTFLIAQNSGAHTNKYAATVSKLYNAGPGGIVMYLGGHNYGAGGNTIAELNGQRMILNAVFQPPTRPAQCNLVIVPSAALASIEGRVVTDAGMGISGAVISVTNATTGESSVSRTSPFGYFRSEELPVGDLYIITVQHKRYEFTNNTISFTLQEDVTGLLFTANAPHGGAADAKSSVANPASRISTSVVNSRVSSRRSKR